jgi:hypothetical protein
VDAVVKIDRASLPGDGLRDLALQIEPLAHAHPEHSRASEAVSMLIDYLTLRARLSDYEAEAFLTGRYG